VARSSLTLADMRIYSYFSIPTDIAASLRDWPEFVSGEEYAVELKDPITGEQVTIKPIGVEPDSIDYLVVTGNLKGRLYERVVGRAIIELQPHTDNLMIENMD